jgi:hypothetical protein
MMAFTTDPAIDPHLMSAGVNTSNPANRGVHKDGVIGFFVDDNRQHYFMLSNVFQGVGKSAAETSLEFFLQFDSSVNSILRLNRLTGEPERIDLENNRLVFTLPGGTGDLFKYGDGIFAGISIGDATLDDQVDYSDMQTFAANYGIQQNARWSMGDFNLDGRVDFEDLSLLAANYNAGEVQAHADFNALIPEPSTIGGFCLSAVLISRPRSSRHAK